ARCPLRRFEGAGLAQLVEQRSCKPWVAGSNPAAATTTPVSARHPAFFRSEAMRPTMPLAAALCTFLAAGIAAAQADHSGHTAGHGDSASTAAYRAANARMHQGMDIDVQATPTWTSPAA